MLHHLLHKYNNTLYFFRENAYACISSGGCWFPCCSRRIWYDPHFETAALAISSSSSSRSPSSSSAPYFPFLYSHVVSFHFISPFFYFPSRIPYVVLHDYCILWWWWNCSSSSYHWSSGGGSYIYALFRFLRSTLLLYHQFPTHTTHHHQPTRIHTIEQNNIFYRSTHHLYQREKNVTLYLAHNTHICNIHYAHNILYIWNKWYHCLATD